MFKDLALPIPSVTSKQTPLSKGILCYLKKNACREVEAGESLAYISSVWTHLNTWPVTQEGVACDSALKNTGQVTRLLFSPMVRLNVCEGLCCAAELDLTNLSGVRRVC